MMQDVAAWRRLRKAIAGVESAMRLMADDPARAAVILDRAAGDVGGALTSLGKQPVLMPMKPVSTLEWPVDELEALVLALEAYRGRK